jgi:hypothetical protein
LVNSGGDSIAPVLAVKHTSQAGEAALATVTLVAGGFAVSGRDWAGTDLDVRVEGSLRDVFNHLPWLGEIGTGVTEIELADETQIHSVLGAFHVARPSEPQTESALLIANLSDRSHAVDIDRFLGEDEILEDSEISLSMDAGLIPRWIRFNDWRGAIVVGSRRSGVLLLDLDDVPTPVLSQNLAYWGFSSEGGVTSWAGGTTVGLCGPDLYVRYNHGDVDSSEISLTWTPRAATTLAKWVADDLLGSGAEMALTRTVVGFPGLDEALTRGYEELSGFDIQGDEVWLETNSGFEDLVWQIVERRSSEVREAVNALRNPDSTMGRQVYSRLKQLIDDEEVSWHLVDAALRGNDEDN